MTLSANLVLLLSALMAIAPSDDAVIAGRIVFVQERDEAELRHDKAFFAHQSFQYVVVKVDRIVLGRVSVGQMLVGVELNSSRSGSDGKREGSGIGLDRGLWKRGARVVMRVRSPEAFGTECAPERIWIGKTASTERSTFVDNALQPYVDLPVLCTDANDAFALADK